MALPTFQALGERRGEPSPLALAMRWPLWGGALLRARLTVKPTSLLCAGAVVSVAALRVTELVPGLATDGRKCALGERLGKPTPLALLDWRPRGVGRLDSEVNGKSNLSATGCPRPPPKDRAAMRTSTSLSLTF